MAGESNRREFVRAAAAAASGIMAASSAAVAAAPERAAARPSSMGARFRELLNGPEPLICANAFDLMTARLIQIHGFKGVFVGSSATNQEKLALPDQAIVTVGEIIEYDSIIAQNVDIPLMADVDDFGTSPLNVYRFAKQAERGGIACAAFDDRAPLNRATGYAVPGIFPKDQMIDRIHAAADARTDMVLIARCLAPTPNGSRTEMLDRAATYAEAGADAVWIAMPTVADYVKAADIVKKPLMAVFGNGNFPATPAALKAARISVTQTPPVVNIALGAVDRALTELQATGKMTEAQKGAISRDLSDKIEQVEELNTRSRKYRLPQGSATER
ncbi:MAG TPA: isocitrate lyase/PEP mutase family protein [Micropepsaceae bacterium]|nr:isocitrate lyase/PEP mutase family protein [Micropepsaceae bacterium]